MHRQNRNKYFNELTGAEEYHYQIMADELKDGTKAPPKAGGKHYVNFAMRWGTASEGASRRRTTPKRGSSLSGRWMVQLLSYSLSGGHDGAMLPINPRGLNGPLVSHFIFSSHMYFSLNAPTHYKSPTLK